MEKIEFKNINIIDNDQCDIDEIDIGVDVDDETKEIEIRPDGNKKESKKE